MKRLLVLRHAKAMPHSPSGSDFDRVLTSRGHCDAADVGRELGHPVDAILASPAQRVVDTLAAVAQAAGLDAAPQWDRRLYNASLDALMAVIGEIDDRAATALIVAHNPGLQQLVAHLADRESLSRMGGSFPTAALADLELRVDRWRDVSPGCGRLRNLVRR
jgi:phosphohistidine phosphatase